MSAADVRIQGLIKSFGDLQAVDKVDLHVGAGEVFFLLGPSGCGKTTLLRAIAGFNDPDQGTIHIGDREVSKLPASERDTAMVFQSYALWPHMTVEQNVAFGLEMKGVKRSRARDQVHQALDMVQLAGRATDRPNQLSGGQQQRVALARALVVEPACLLLDEPLSNLDAKLRLEMRSEIRRICKDAGLTAIYVTHDQKEALSIADRIAVMRDGKVLQVGVPREIYQRPVDRFVASFVGESNFVTGKVAAVSGDELTVASVMGAFEARGLGEHRHLVGSEVVLSIRPEALVLGAPPTGAVNVLRGTLRDSVFLGDIAQHTFHPTEGPEFKIVNANPRTIVLGESESVQVWVAPLDVVVLPDA